MAVPSSCGMLGKKSSGHFTGSRAFFAIYCVPLNGCYVQLSLAESCVDFCDFGLHLCENAVTTLFPAWKARNHLDSRAAPGSTSGALAPEAESPPHPRRRREMAGTASPVPVSTASCAADGAFALFRRSVRGQCACDAWCGGHRASAVMVDPPGGNRQRGRFEPAWGGDRAAGFSRPHPGAAVRSLLACGCGLE